jgi:hypothetical protein
VETTRTTLHHKEITQEAHHRKEIIRTTPHHEEITTAAHHHKETSNPTVRRKMEGATTHSRVTHKLDKMVEVMRGIILQTAQVTMDRLLLVLSKGR